MDKATPVTTTFSSSVGGYTHCKVCRRPLSDHLSMKVGMGPICRENAGTQAEDLFSIRSDFMVEVEDRIVLVMDLDLGGRSVTNDATHVVDDLVRRGILSDGMRLIYRDSNGEWSEMLHRGGQFSTFASLATRDIKDRDEAVALTRERYRHLLG